MEAHELSTLKKQIRSLPYSRMVYPKSRKDRAKHLFWTLYTPLHPLVRDVALCVGIVQHKGRQPFLLGTLAPGQSIEELLSFLVSRGFANHFVAWRDDGELVSLRYVEDFTYQYHLRIFKDGEVRAHYEYTPECRPGLHMRNIGMEPRREYFLNLLGNRIVEAV